MCANIVCAKQNLAEQHSVARIFTVRYAAHKTLVAAQRVREQHVQVALLHLHIIGFNQGAAVVVNLRRHVCQLGKILEVLQRGQTPPVLVVRHKGRAVHGRKHGALPANVHVARRVARQLCELGGRVAQMLQQQFLLHLH